MTNQEVYSYIEKNIKEHLLEEEYVADAYVKNGFGQIRGGYFEVAYRKNIKIWMQEAEPSQKWHLLVSYYDGKAEDGNFDMQKQANLYRIMCPQLMLWIAEIAGLKKKILQSAVNEAIKYEKENNTKDSRKIKRVLGPALHWDDITKTIKTESTWDEVRNKVSKFI